ncbi:MAG: hypothetical protein JXA04_12400, partial [Gammaproteobacteria bacterium]|nr:hypothetical protein [Gammaproteobacteria bacterium]
MIAVIGTKLENNNVSHIEFNRGAGVEDVFETGMSSPHEGTEQCGVAKEPASQELRHGQDQSFGLGFAHSSISRVTGIYTPGLIPI